MQQVCEFAAAATTTTTTASKAHVRAAYATKKLASPANEPRLGHYEPAWLLPDLT